jgi:hypothetical protein
MPPEAPFSLNPCPPEWKCEFNGHTFKGNGWELSSEQPSWWKHQILIKNELRPKFRKEL